MRTLLTVAFGATLICAPGYSQQSSPSQNEQDVPHQKPGTNNPDVSKERHPAPAPNNKNDTQQEGDVPHQKPGTDNPDVGKQRQPDGKKNKHSKPTSSSTRS
jgi:type IV secretory pathway VirB10-like protein